MSVHAIDPSALQTLSAIPSSDRVLQVLVCIARAGQSIAAREIAAQTGIPLSTVYRQLAPLKKWGLVQEHAQSGLYEPGPLAMQLAWGFDHHSYLMAEARPEIEQLVQRSGESVGLLVHVNGQVICLDMQESQQALRCSFTKGSANSLLRGASAKALLAYLPEPVQEAQMTPLAEHEREILQAQLAQIRQQGYAVTENEIDEGVWGVSVPIFSHKDKLEASLSLMAPVSRAQQRHADYIQMTIAAAARIGQKLRYN
ncbi:IclR family transcriptional regulator [Undibacterium sp. Jales W-56]|uniref:IclR family transcriptional regulator n=1 Tax=Undibacterium sp. Jales W-56 TaxID=2897325 RepID=UPI0021D3B029|nr:IclR family transcriptional regulator [Undibacterium sp. Jales W-56]MCU6435715.1 IclR family transcriptional regulator [Undibacterium sp. Jales W-56]